MEFIDFSKVDFWSKENQFSKYADVKSRKEFGQYHENAELTIAIPVYNRTTFLREAIDSALQQKTDRVYDIIVVDNASEGDAIQQIVSSYPHDKIVYFRNDENIGMTGNWNRCYELAKTKWVTLLHDDDRLKSDYVESVLVVVDNCDTIGCLGTLHDDVDENGNILRGTDGENGSITRITVKDFYRQLVPINIAGLLMNREKVIEIGGFNEKFYPAHDSNLIARMCAAYGGEKIYKNLSDYRIAENESFNHKTLYGFVSYSYKQLESIYKKDIVSLPFLLHKVHLNVMMTSLEDAILAYWRQSLDYKEIRILLGYKRANCLERLANKFIIKFFI